MTIIGTSGFMYREWKNTFYPEGFPMSSYLSYYSRNFNGVEINSTFYRLPVKSSIKNYKRVNLIFVFKLFRGITHYGHIEEKNIKPFLEIKDILEEKLFGFLAQFPASFKATEKNKNFIIDIINAFSGIPVVCELRSKDWEKESKFFKENNIPVCFSDFPITLHWFKEGNATRETAYFRFHGRRKLYDYCYSDEELKEFAEKIKSVESKTKLCFFNNTAKGYAPKNALKLKELLQI
ncbi:DUF72 domain-containing protein [Desulfurobacterium sp.]|uniref:DUF72 domain-containing protein n=1 Tax=Desulfurobacterium sp. TaxID=2004706 RepID=UPI002610C015|nr:DUF72 domain-containing protein [Desulfurobacterium sp.]